MNNIERRDQQILYISDDAVFEDQKKCRDILCILPQETQPMNTASGASSLFY